MVIHFLAATCAVLTAWASVENREILFQIVHPVISCKITYHTLYIYHTLRSFDEIVCIGSHLAIYNY